MGRVKFGFLSLGEAKGNKGVRKATARAAHPERRKREGEVLPTRSSRLGKKLGDRRHPRGGHLSI